MALPSAEPPPAHQETVAVKFIGTVRPASSGKQRIVFASYEDCLGKSPSNIGQGEVAPDGSFKLEIFARWGADYTLCAVELAGEGKATQRYGKAARELSPREPGDVRFRDLVVELSQGPARSFPGPRPSGGF